MQGFLDKLKGRVDRFMQGRYGADHIGTALVCSALALSILANWVDSWMTVLALILLLLATIRLISFDIDARRRENEIVSWAVRHPRKALHRACVKFANRKTKIYVRCPYCDAEFALPKGKGRVRATCPKCGQRSQHTA